MPNLDTIQTVGIWASFLTLLGVLVRQLGPWRKISVNANERLRDDLLERETALVARMEKLERTLNRERIRHNAERSLDRHRLNNVTQCFDALLMLIKANPDKAGESVAMIEEMRAKQLMAETEEKAIIRAAEITADEMEADHDGN